MTEEGIKQRIDNLNISDDMKLVFNTELDKTKVVVKNLPGFNITDDENTPVVKGRGHWISRKDVLKALDSEEGTIKQNSLSVKEEGKA